VTSLSADAYLDFFYESEDRYMRGLWQSDYRPADNVTKDRAGFYTPRFLAKLMSEVPEYTELSFEAYVIARLSANLKSTAGELALTMSDELFSLYAPTDTDFIPQDTPMPEFFSRFDDDDWLAFNEPLVERALDKALSARGINRSAKPSFHRFEHTLDHLIQRAALGRPYEVVTGLPRLDAWLVEAQACLQEFVVPNGFGDEVIHRRYLHSQIFNYSYDQYDIFDDDTELEDELGEMPMNVLAAFDGEKLVQVESRDEALAFYTRIQDELIKREKPVSVPKASKKSILDKIKSWRSDRRADIF
jgi:hypothetical protein